MTEANRTALALAGSFGRNALRQPVYTALLAIPPFIGLLIRPLLIVLHHRLPAFDIGPWIPLFLAVTAGFPPYLFGLLSALMLLEERDRDLLPAFRVTPIPDRALLAAKVMPASLLSLVGVPACLYLSGEAHRIPPWAPAALGVIAVPTAAFYTLLVTSVSRNKVQALTAGKLLGTALGMPVALALLPAPWRFTTLLFPSSWTAAALLGVEPGGFRWLWFGGGLVFTTGLAFLAWKSARKRYFR